MKAFVTGGTGFVGAHLVQALCARGDTVTCLVRSPERAAALGWRAVRLVQGDLEDRAALRAGAAGAEVIYHVAGRISAPSAAAFMRANRDGTAHLLEVASEQPPRRFVLVSSLAAGGPTAPGRPIDESSPPAPVTPYGESKLAAEVLVRKATALSWTIVRPPTVYGERDRELLKVFKLARWGVAPVFGDGSQELSVIYAGDLAAALVAATAPGAANRVYYAADPAITTSAALVRAIGRAVGREPRVVPLPGVLARGLLRVIGTLAHLAGRATLLSADKAAEFLAPAWTCRPEALIRDTGWRPATDLETGLRRTAQWYRQAGWL
ncbi:MAG TPA: NAD(P)-dependent oxidoreductase [Gemmatimonadales bacterium]|nr:NAD(P)-dependent oxidoreductase [Gemmatimonadales bacterium]